MNRNHHRLLRREWEKVKEFCQALGLDEGIQAELWPADGAEREPAAQTEGSAVDE